MYSVAGFVIALEALIVYQIATNRINLHLLISDGKGNASLSRLQLLLFTFVIGSGFVYITVKSSGFPTISEGVLELLGISGATYAIGKTLEKPTSKVPAAAEGDTPPPTATERTARLAATQEASDA
jgi:hypothetical protein